MACARNNLRQILSFKEALGTKDVLISHRFLICGIYYCYEILKADLVYKSVSNVILMVNSKD